MEKDPENMLSKDILKKVCSETKDIAEKWFNGKDDNWLKLSSKICNEITNHELMLTHLRHMMYHVGHCEALFRENGIETGEWIDW
jgi:arsenate reductase-like glutaredoxin family protein